MVPANTTLEQDKCTVLAVWKSMGGDIDVLMRAYFNEDYEVKMRDEPSDDVSEWWGVEVEEGRVTRLQWSYIHDEQDYGEDEPIWTDAIPAKLTGTIPAEIAALSALTRLGVEGNELEGPIPASLGCMTCLKVLDFGCNNLSGTVPATLGNLPLTSLNLLDNLSLDAPDRDFFWQKTSAGLFRPHESLQRPQPPQLRHRHHQEPVGRTAWTHNRDCSFASQPLLRLPRHP